MRLIQKKEQIGWITAIASIFSLCSNIATTQAGSLPEVAVWGNPTCALDRAAIAEKNNLRKNSLNSETTAQAYQDLLTKHKANLEKCRSKTWPATQATWLRLYANDVKPGVLDDVLDRIVNRGYNQVFIEVFYDGRVLLPVSDNPTPWRSITAEAVKAGEVPADYDLWAEAIKKAKSRGLKVYGWAFAMNFGYAYAEIRDRASVLARNGENETSISKTLFDSKLATDGKAFYLDAFEPDHLFVDPYSKQARADLANVVTMLGKRNPDGMVFDYVRYPTSYGANSLVTNIKQLWIYSEASRQALLNSLPNSTARKLMSIYLDKGIITGSDMANIENLTNALTQTKQISTSPELEKSAVTAERFLWQIATNHAYKGVLIFVSEITYPLRKQNIPTGSVFFPGGNYRSSNGYDARMQPWDKFPKEMQRHPMTYALCEDGYCVADQVTKVLQQSTPGTLICPVLAGTWGQPFDGHPSYETQMQAIKATSPKIDCVSHFVYAWMEPESDRQRKAGIAVGDK